MNEDTRRTGGRSDRTEWLDAGLALLTREGPRALRVERLAAEVKLTKGSFYHHFGGLGAFKRDLLARAEEVEFTAVVRAADAAEVGSSRFARLADAVAAGSPALEIALRAWAHEDGDAADLVGRLDRARLAVLEDRLADLSRDPERTRRLARLAYAVYLGALALRPPVDGPEFRALFAELERLAAAPDGAA